MNREKLKADAKEMIKGKIGMLFVVTLLIAVVTWIANFVLSFIPVIGSLATAVFVSAPFALSLIKIYLNVTKGIKPGAQDAFSGFSDFWSAFKVNFLVGLFTALWSLLFVIPGIIKAFSYSMAMYILAENEGMPALEAISRSKEMMEGHKMEYFVLSLSFIGWAFLTVITFGLAGIWVMPYMNTTMANFYLSLKGEEEPPIIEAEATTL